MPILLGLMDQRWTKHWGIMFTYLNQLNEPTTRMTWFIKQYTVVYFKKVSHPNAVLRKKTYQEKIAISEDQENFKTLGAYLLFSLKTSLFYKALTIPYEGNCHRYHENSNIRLP